LVSYNAVLNSQVSSHPLYPFRHPPFLSMHSIVFFLVLSPSLSWAHSRENLPIDHARLVIPLLRFSNFLGFRAPPTTFLLPNDLVKHFFLARFDCAIFYLKKRLSVLLLGFFPPVSQFLLTSRKPFLPRHFFNCIA